MQIIAEGPLVTLALTYGAIAMLPGSNFLIVSQLALRAPRSYACLSALGIASGAAVVAAAAFAGGPLLSPLTGQAWLFDVVFVGLMARLGFRALRRSTQAKRQTVTGASALSCFRLGLFTALTNPTTAATMLTLATGPRIKPGDCEPLVCAATIFIIAGSWFGIVALVFCDARLKRIYVRLQPWIDPMLGVLLLALATRTLLQLVVMAST